MIDHRSLKELARTSRVRLTDLIAMGSNNDPFLADRPSRRIGAEWFADLYRQFGFGQGVHLRRIHYRIISAATPIRKPDAKDYENTEQCWDYLVNASRDARYLGLVPSGCFVDRRNPDPLIFYNAEQDFKTSVDGGTADIDAPSEEFPDLPSYKLENWYDLKPPSPYLVEVWIEKTTMQDVLVPLCQPRGVNLIPGAGELSETRTHELLERAIAANKPVRIFYISDFDPGGRCMPVSVSRRIEFYLRQGGIDLDLRLIPLALTHHQCVEYALPRTPIKDAEARGPAFERRFGKGATELDALEALHPGSLRKIVEQAINRYLDPEYPRTFGLAVGEYRAGLDKVNEDVHEAFDSDLQGLRERWTEAREVWESLEDDLHDTCEDIESELRNNPPAPFQPPPHPEASEPDSTEVLFDSRRDYLTQCDCYKAWQGGGAP